VETSEHLIALEHLALIWGAVFVAAVLAKKTRLTPVLFFLFLGFLMVNLGWLPTEPHPFIRAFAELGIIVIMFALGFEESTANFLDSAKRSWGIALFGALAPFLWAFGVAEYFWDDTRVALMVGLAMTATAVSLTMVSLRSEGLQGSPAATRIMTSAVLDDIGALALVAIIVPLAAGENLGGIGQIGWIIAKVVLFFVVVWFVAAWVLPHKPTGLVKRIPLLNRFGARHLLAFGEGEYATLTVLILALAAGLLSHFMGFHPAVGAYMAGLILREEYFERNAETDSFADTLRILNSAAFSWIGPVFFVQLGTQLLLDWDVVRSVIPQTLTLLLGLLVVQTTSAGLAARYTSGLDGPHSLLVGLGMLGRAELAFVVMDIAYVQHEILTTEAFYTLMLTALGLNIAVPVSISMWKRRFGTSRES